MDLHDKMILQLSNNDKNIAYDIQFTAENTLKPFDEEVIAILYTHKKIMDDIDNLKKWDYYKKLSNPYELINHSIKKKCLNLGLGNYTPISRAFYKFWELIMDFDLINTSGPISYAALAEGPGGFIEAFNFYRRKYYNNPRDTINCITLRDPKNSKIPSWDYIDGCKFNISWGHDGTGNLYKLRNIQEFRKLFTSTTATKADLVTADGGFDFTGDYTYQEISIQRLLLCESVSAMAILKRGGHFVLKIFDMFYTTTVEIIYILSFYFKHVTIVKPHTSRPANSEKYLVCKNFQGISEIDLHQLYEIISAYSEHAEDQFVASILKTPVPDKFIRAINSYNIWAISNQIKYLLKTNFNMTRFLTNDIVNDIKNKQTVCALGWCLKYNFDINKKSNYINFDPTYNFIPYFL